MRRRSRFDLCLLGLTLLALGLRLFRLGHQSLWIDEAMTVSWIDEIDKRGWRSLIQNIHGPLPTALMVFMSRLSMNEWALRLPSALAGTLAVPILGLFGRALWGSRVAMTAATLLAISPFALYYSHEVRGYSFAILFSSMAALAAWRFALHPSWRRVFLLLFCELLCMSSNLNGVFLALGLNAFLLWRLRTSRRGLTFLFLAHLLVVVALLPYTSQIQRQVRLERLFGVETDFGSLTALRGETTLHPMALPYSAFAFAVGSSLGPTLQELRVDPGSATATRHLPVLVLVFLGFGVPLVWGCLQRDTAGARNLLLISGSWVVLFVVWLAALNMKPFNVRYLAVLLPFYFLLVARGLWALPRRLAWCCAVAALVVSLWSCANYWFVPRYGRDDVRGALRFVQEHAAIDDPVLHISLISPLAYYRDLRPAHVFPASTESGRSQDAARAYVAELAARGPVLWYLECRPEGPDPHGYLRGALIQGAAEHQKWEFTGITVYRFSLIQPDHLDL